MIDAGSLLRGTALSDQDVRLSAGRSDEGESPIMSAAEVSDFPPIRQPRQTTGAETRLEAWVADHLNRLLSLEQDWDSHGAVPITLRAASDARYILVQLLEQRVPMPMVVPIPDGGISLEWRQPSLELAIEVPGTLGLQSASAYLRDEHQGIEWEDDLAAAMPWVAPTLDVLRTRGG